MLPATSPQVAIGTTLLATGAMMLALGTSALAIGSAPVPPPDGPCSTSVRLVSSVLGSPVVRTTPVATDGMKSCTFVSGKAIPYATIATSRQASVAAAAALYRMQIGFAAGNVAGKPLKLRGIGDEAASLDGFLYARKGRALYQFSIVEFGPQPRELPNVQRLAKAVLATVKP